MTDRELLEKAAKAAGIAVRPMEIKNVTMQGDDRFIGLMTEPEQWARGWFNPLTNDGDALRLAVKLMITPHIDGNLTDAEGMNGNFTESHFDDPYAATRRAIVRAAAAIGETL